MGAWSAEPFGNDAAVDWGWELDGSADWRVVEEVFDDVLRDGPVDEEAGVIAIAAAEVVARGLGRPTQADAYCESAVAFVSRAGTPGSKLVELATAALAKATAADSELRELWDGDPEWDAANARIAAALGSPAAA